MRSRYIFLATGQGLVTFERNKEEWGKINHLLEDKTITSVTAGQEVILAGTTAGIFRSQDKGQTWQPANPKNGWRL